MPEPVTITQNTNRKQWLDAIKGVAIILVVMSHTYEVPYLHQYLTACYMPLFFLASGYVFSNRAGALTKRKRQLLLPYLGWGLFYLLLATAMQHNFDYNKVISWISGIAYSRFSFTSPPYHTSDKLFPPGAAPLWFLTCMMTSYCGTIPLIIAKGKSLILLILLYIGISAALMYCPILLPWSLDTAFMGALFIFTGYKLKSIQITRKWLWFSLILGSLVYVVLVQLNGGINMSIRVYGDLGLLSLPLFYIIGILGTVLYSSFFIIVEKSFLCSFFAYFGRITLTIMCSHMLFASASKILLNHLIQMGIDIPNKLVIPVRLIIILIGCILIQHLTSYTKRRISAFSAITPRA